MNSIYAFDQLSKLTQVLQNKQVVIAGGCFDLLHLGHIIFLQKAKQQGEVLVVLLESDETIQKLKGPMRPIHNQSVRAQILAELKSVDKVLMLPRLKSDQEYDEIIEKIKPSVIATTEGDKYDFHKKRQSEKYGAKLVYVTQLVEDHSSSLIIEKIQQARP